MAKICFLSLTFKVQTNILSLSLKSILHAFIQISIRILLATVPLSFKQVMQNTPIHLLIAGIACLHKKVSSIIRFA